MPVFAIVILVGFPLPLLTIVIPFDKSVVFNLTAYGVSITAANCIVLSWKAP